MNKIEQLKRISWAKAYELAPGDWCENYRDNLAQDILIQEIVQACIKELETTKMCDSYTGEYMSNCEYNDALADGIANIKENFGVE